MQGKQDSTKQYHDDVQSIATRKYTKSQKT